MGETKPVVLVTQGQEQYAWPWQVERGCMNITDLIPRVVQAMKTTPQLRPTLYAQFSGRSVESWPINVNVFQGTGREKAQTLFTLGREVARRPENNGRSLIESCLVTETWLGDANELGNVRPINAPANKRQEGVMFLVVPNNPPFTPLAHLYIIKRKGGKVSELVFLHESDQITGLLAQAFTAGARSIDVPDDVLNQRPFDPRPFLA